MPQGLTSPLAIWVIVMPGVVLAVVALHGEAEAAELDAELVAEALDELPGPAAVFPPLPAPPQATTSNRPGI